MPISAIVIRLAAHTAPATVSARLAAVPGVELGDYASGALAGVVEASDYPAHDAALDALAEVHGVCAVDIVFHDFSDVTQFDRLPRRQRSPR
jgi:nitrate reductase NapAB chaperone NapD